MPNQFTDLRAETVIMITRGSTTWSLQFNDARGHLATFAMKAWRKGGAKQDHAPNAEAILHAIADQLNEAIAAIPHHHESTRTLEEQLAEMERERDLMRLQAQGEKAIREDAEAECAKLERKLAEAVP